MRGTEAGPGPLPRHDNIGHLGAWSRCVAKVEDRILKVNDNLNVSQEHGLVFGYAIVCKIRNADGVLEDYFDLNVDTEGPHKNEAVPEQVTENAMFKASVDAAETGVHMPGNDMHAGPDVGSYYFMFPVTEEIADSLGWKVEKTGLVVGYHPANEEVLAKFKNGTYTGFSIEGARVEYEEIEEAD